ncbi:MAG: DUF5050 domain-containing protein [Lachnospiraceae bacterium]|nr:DUF5050 domain-containing protein [Candidatus Colinaster scatohippi]
MDNENMNNPSMTEIFGADDMRTMPVPPMQGMPQGQPMPGQPVLGQPVPPMQGMPQRIPMPGQPMPGQSVPPMQGMPQRIPMPGQPMPGQPVPPMQGMPGQPMPGQPMPGQPVPPMQGMPQGQPVPEQPIPEQPKDEKAKPVKEKKKNSVAGIVIAIVSIVIIIAGVGLSIYSLLPKNKYNQDEFASNNKELETDIKEVDTFQGINDTSSSSATSWEYGWRVEIAEDDNNYYLPDYKNNYKLCKISKSDYSKTVVVDMPVSNVNVIGDKLYFINSFVDTSDDNGIYAVNTDGTGLECILPGTYTRMLVVNDWIYYVSGYDYNLYKINVFGRNTVKLVTEHVSDIDIYENTIYYSTYDEDRNKRDAYKIAAIDVDGNNRVQYTDYVEYYSIDYDDGYIYYAQSDSCIGRIDTFSKENEKLTDCYTNNALVVSGDRIYFIDGSKDISLAVYSISDGSIKHYNVKNVDSYYVGEDTLITLYMDSSFNPVVTANDINTGAVIDLFK